MQENIKSQWTTALRSGEYQQAKRTLRETTTQGTYQYCCLGVLCDLYAKDKDPEFWNKLTDFNTEFLPEVVWQWAGLTSQTVRVVSKGSMLSVAGLNDNGKAFDDIADLIDSTKL